MEQKDLNKKKKENKFLKKVLKRLKELTFNQVIIFLVLILILSIFIFIAVSELINQGRINSSLSVQEQLLQEFREVRVTPVTYGIDNYIYVQDATPEELAEIQRQNPGAEVKSLEGNLREFLRRSDPTNPNWELDEQRIPSSGLDSTGVDPSQTLH